MCCQGARKLACELDAVNPSVRIEREEVCHVCFGLKQGSDSINFSAFQPICVVDLWVHVLGVASALNRGLT